MHRIGRTGRAGATGIAITFVDWADLHRWKMINKALDLPFDDPQETYSSSEHFLHDQGIAPGTKGRLVPEGSRSSASRAPRACGRGGRALAAVVAQRRPQPRSDAAARRRSQGGVRRRPAARPQRPPQASSSGDRPGAGSRNRSRRRTRGGKPAAAGRPADASWSRYRGP